MKLNLPFIYALAEHSCADVRLFLKAGIDLKEACMCTGDYEWYLAIGKCEACARLLADYKGVKKIVLSYN